MANKYNGEVSLVIGDKSLTLVYDWKAIAELQTEHSGDVLANLFDAPPESLASILAIGLKKFHPDITKEFILENSQTFPLIPTKQAIDRAFLFAYWGADTVKKADEAAAKKAEPKEKKTK